MANKYYQAAANAWAQGKAVVTKGLSEAAKATGSFGAGSIPVSEATKFIPKKKKKKK